MSGLAPETERERQVRQLAGRLLTWPDPEGPLTVDLIPVGYPEEFPPELVDLTELRFLGSAVRRHAGKLVSVEMVFEGRGEPEAVLSSYEASLLSLGWERLDQPGPIPGGFVVGGFPETSLLVERQKSVAINPQALHREDGGIELRVRYSPGHSQDMLSNIAHRRIMQEGSILPRLKPPPGVRLRPDGTGGRQGSGNRTRRRRQRWRRWSWKPTSPNNSRRPVGGA